MPDLPLLPVTVFTDIIIIGTERHSFYLLTATFNEISQVEHHVKECLCLQGSIIIPLTSAILR
jgi:hypothetical protein